jgi:hypothetical protein
VVVLGRGCGGKIWLSYNIIVPISKSTFGTRHGHRGGHRSCGTISGWSTLWGRCSFFGQLRPAASHYTLLCYVFRRPPNSPGRVEENGLIGSASGSRSPILRNSPQACHITIRLIHTAI